jgi:hypothetical protein
VLERGQLDEFAERGFLVLRQVVPPDVVTAAAKVIDYLVGTEPPAVQGPYNHFARTADYPELAALLTGSTAFALAESLTGPGTLEMPWQAQIALNIPPFPHRPGAPHIDCGHAEPNGEPVTDTFTLLAGVLMTDQLTENAGNLWVWPGTHLAHAAYFRQHGPQKFCAYPPIELPAPEQVTGRAGDLLLAHYLLGHNIGGNTSPAVRRAVYYRVKRAGHDPRWREFLTDPWLDYDVIRAGRE